MMSQAQLSGKQMQGEEVGAQDRIIAGQGSITDRFAYRFACRKEKGCSGPLPRAMAAKCRCTRHENVCEHRGGKRERERGRE